MTQNQQYQGKAVQSVREARQGDQGFKQGQDQVVVTLQDGTEKTVRRNEVTQGQQQGQGQGQGQGHQQGREGQRSQQGHQEQDD